MTFGSEPSLRFAIPEATIKCTLPFLVLHCFSDITRRPGVGGSPSGFMFFNLTKTICSWKGYLLLQLLLKNTSFEKERRVWLGTANLVYGTNLFFSKGNIRFKRQVCSSNLQAVLRVVYHTLVCFEEFVTKDTIDGNIGCFFNYYQSCCTF